MKRVFSIFISLFLVFGLLLTGCSANSGNSGNTVSDTGSAGNTDQAQTINNEKEQITLRLAWWGSQTRHDKMMAIANEYMERFPNITIEPQMTGKYTPDYKDKLVAQMAATNEPDMFWTTIQRIGLYAEKNVFLDLNPYVGDLLDISGVAPSLIEAGSVDGNLYCIANGVNASAILYDPDLFEQAGIEKPSIDWTWDDLKQVCRTIKDELGIYGLSAPPVSYKSFHYFLRQNGYEWYSDDNKSLGFSDASVVEKFFSLSLELQEEGLCPPPDVTAQIKGSEDQLLPKGEAGLSFVDSNQITTLSAVAKKPLDFLVMPGPDSKKGMFLKPSCFIAGSVHTKYPEEVVKYINYFLNDEKAGEIFMGEVGVPVSSYVRQHLPNIVEGDNSVILTRQFDLVDFLSDHSSSVNLLYPEEHAEMQQVLQDTVDKVLYKVLTPAEAAAEFMSKASEIMAD